MKVMNIVDHATSKFDSLRDKLSLGGITRSELGLARARNMVRQAFTNLADLYGGRDLVYESVRRFSSAQNRGVVRRNAATTPPQNVGPQYPSFNTPSTTRGVSSVQNLQTVSAADITIDALIYSFLPFTAIERELTTSTEQIAFKKVVALNDAGGLAKGETAIGTFTPENPDINLHTPVKELEIVGDGKVASVSFNNQLFEGTCIISYTPNGGSELVGKDDSGIVVFPKITNTFQVDYESGTFQSTEVLAAGDKVKIQAMLDANANPEGTYVLRTTTKLDKVDLVTRPASIYMEDSNDKILYIMRAIKASDGGITMEQYLAQMLYDIYVTFINNMIMVKFHQRFMEVSGTNKLITKDLSAYAGQIIADPVRKYDELSALIQDIDGTMLENCNLSATCIIVGSNIAKIMLNDTQRFVKSDTHKANLNTLIGTYDGLPVLRHNYIDKHIDNKDPDGYGHLFLVYRDPDGEVGYLAYGEFLPVHTTENVYNFNNPMQFVKALASQPGIAVINKDLCMVGRFRINKK